MNRTPFNEAENSNDDSFNILRYFQRCRKHWKWFLCSVLILLGFAMAYLHQTKPYCSVSTKIQIQSEANSSGASSSMLNNLNFFNLGGQKKGLEDKVQIFSSYDLAKEVADSLMLNVNIQRNNKSLNLSQKRQLPFRIYQITKFSKKDNLARKNKHSFILKILDDQHYNIKDLQTNKSYSFKSNDTIKSSDLGFIIKSRKTTEQFVPETYYISISNSQTIPQIKASIIKSSSIIQLTVDAPSFQDGEVILNEIIDVYNRTEVDAKYNSIKETITFLDERLDFISKSLKGAETNVEQYKKQQNLTDLSSIANSYLSNSDQYEKKVVEEELKLNLIKSIAAYLKDSQNDSEIVPSNLGINDPTFLSLIEEFNRHQLEKLKMTKGMTNDNPILQRYKERTVFLKKTILENLANIEKGVKINLNLIKKQQSIFLSKIETLPTQEKETRILLRQQNIKETLFMFLIKKREEAEISLMSANKPDTQIIDAARILPGSVRPKSKLILGGAFLLGILIPLILIYFRELFNNRVFGTSEIKKFTSFPFLGMIPSLKENSTLKERHLDIFFSEQFRKIAIDIDFLLKEEKQKIIMVASSNPGEGKLSFSVLLSQTLSQIGKKTLMINANMHKKETNFLKQFQNEGLASYLEFSNKQLSDVINQTSQFPNLYVVSSGVSNLAPSMLLYSQRVNDLFSEIDSSDFDYVIVNTPSLDLFGDALILAEKASMMLYIFREDYTTIDNIRDAENLYQEHRVKKMASVLNVNGINNLKYFKYLKGHNRNKFNQSK